MQLTFQLNFQNNNFQKFILVNEIDRITKTIVHYFYFVGDHHLLINFVELETMQTINRQHYPFKRVSNVLAFPLKDRNQVNSFQDPWAEIYICLPLVLQECFQNKLKVNDHINQLLIHAFLHLLGYHHQNNQEWDLAEQLSKEIRQMSKKLF